MSNHQWSDGLSKSRISKAGSNLRKWARGELSDEELTPWIETIYTYRLRFPTPLGKVAAGLRSFTATANVEGTVSQRLKRFPTILNKLIDYEAGLDLSRMRDIGGCRVVCTSMEGIERLHSRIHRRWDVTDTIDYIANPRSSGYRSLHLIVKRDHVPIEIQLRTVRMHEWAETVEAFSSAFGQNFKKDAGGELIQQFMKNVSDMDQLIDQNLPIPVDLQSQTARLGRRVRQELNNRVPRSTD